MDIKTHHCQYIVENVDSKYILHFFDDNGRLVFEEEFGDKSRKEVEDVGKEFINRGDKFIVSYILEKQSMFWNLTYANKRSNDSILIGRYSLNWSTSKYYIAKEDISFWAKKGDLITFRQTKSKSFVKVDVIVNQIVYSCPTHSESYDIDIRHRNDYRLNRLNFLLKYLTPISFDESLELGCVYRYRDSLEDSTNNIFQSCRSKHTKELIALHKEYLSKVEKLLDKAKELITL